MSLYSPTTDPGIYVISNKVTGKVYVGQARNPRRRWATHLCDLRKGSHDNSKLQRAFTKYGEDAFIFTVIEVCTEDQLDSREQFFIDSFEALGQMGYNLSPKAGSTKGFRMSPEQKEKLSRIKKELGCTATMLTALQNNAAKRKGKRRPPEVVAKIADANRRRCSGVSKTLDTRCKLSKALAGRRKDPKISAGVNEKISGDRSVHWIENPTPKQLKAREYHQRRKQARTEEDLEHLRQKQRERRQRQREQLFSQISAHADQLSEGQHGSDTRD